MKIKTLLPLALMLLAAPVFAVGQEGPIDSVMQFEIPEYYNISTTNAAINATATVTGDYAGLSVTQMKPTFKIVTNADEETTLVLSASCDVDGGTANALYTSANGATLKLVFTNITATDETKPTTDAVANIAAASGTTAANNANAIGFVVTPSVTAVANSGGNIKSTSGASGVVTYGITNGEYNAVYTLAQTVIPESFSTKDQHGTYKSTLTMSRVATP